MTLKYGIVVFSAWVVGSVAAETINIGAMGGTWYPDGVVATNVAINVCRNDTKELRLRLESRSTSTSALQIAFGKDVNADGDLGPEETSLVIGRRGHEYFIEDVAGDRRYVESGTQENTAGCYLEFDLLTDAEYHPQSVVIATECGRCFSSLGVQDWMYDSGWDTAKLTRRGADAIGELCHVENKFRAMMMLFR